MPTATLSIAPSHTLNGSLVRINSEQYHRMMGEDSHVELIGGLIVSKDRSVIGQDKMSHSPLHRLAVRLLTKLAARIDSPERHLQIQLPIHVGDFDEPEPDAAVIIGPDTAYKNRLPIPGDVASIIESAHSSLARDREDKLAAYAGGGIPQYVIVDLQSGRLEVYTDPDAMAGTYQTKVTLTRHGSLRLNLGNGEFLDIAAEEMLP
jgi:Uma2 family endonuclease